MFGLSIGDLLVLLMTSVFAGGVLNKWVLERFPNHNVYKLSISFALMIILACLDLAAAGNPLHKMLLFYLLIICGGILTGVIADLAMDKWLEKIDKKSKK